MNTEKRRLIILTVGYMHSGKTTFAKQLAQDIPNSICLERDPIASMLHNHFPVLKKIDMQQRLDKTKTIKDKIYELLLTEAVAHDLHVIVSGCNSTRQTRRTIIERYKEQIENPYFVIVYFDIDLSVLEERVRQSSRAVDVLSFSKSFAEGLEKQKAFFEIPTPDEANILLTIHNNRNTQQVIDQLKTILSA